MTDAEIEQLATRFAAGLTEAIVEILAQHEGNEVMYLRVGSAARAARAAEATFPRCSIRVQRDRRMSLALKEFTEPVALSSTQPADLPLPRRAFRLSFGLVALRARCVEEPMGER
jgi:hypothetical protein